MQLLELFRSTRIPIPKRGDETSCRNYFVNRLLRDDVCRRPLTVMGLLATDQAGGYLQSQFDRLTILCHRERMPYDSQLVAVRLHLGNRLGFPVAMLQFPVSHDSGEIGLVAMILQSNLHALAREQEIDPGSAIRYFTLENGTPRKTRLREWNEGRWLDCGDGPAMEPRAFYAHLGELL